MWQFHSLSPFYVGRGISLTQVDFLCPLKSHKMVSNRIHINVCVSVCVLVSTVCSKPLSDGVVSQFTSSDSCIRAALKKEACSFASQSDMGLTPTDFETVCMLVTFGDYGFYFLHRSSWNESGRGKKRKKMVIWVMIILSTAATGDGRATLSRGYSYSKNERWELRNEEMWERNGGRESEQDLDQGEESFKWNWKHMKSVFFWYPNAHLLATSYNGPSEWDRASVRGRETAKPHERRLRLHLSFWRSNSQSSKLSSLESSIWLFWPIVSCYLLHFVSTERKKDYLECDSPEAALHKSFSYAVQYIS